MTTGMWVAIGLTVFGMMYAWALCFMAKRGDNMHVTRKEYYGEHSETRL